MMNSNFCFNDSFNQATSTAQKLAAAAGSKVVKIVHILQAVFALEPSLFPQLLGRPCNLPSFCQKSASKTATGDKPKGKKVIADTDSRESLSNPPLRYSSATHKLLSPFGGYLSEAIKLFGNGVPIGISHIAVSLLLSPHVEVLDFLSSNGISPAQPGYMKNLAAGVQSMVAQQRSNIHHDIVSGAYKLNKRLVSFLNERCFGQSEAIQQITSNILTHQTTCGQNAKPLSLFFLGKSGTGKNHIALALQDAFCEIQGGVSVKTIDLSRFSQENTHLELVGRDTAWKDGGRPGVLTEAAASNPKGVIIVDNVDQGYSISLSYLETVIKTGELMDNFTNKSVSFRDNIIILISSKGQPFWNSRYILDAQANNVRLPVREIVLGLASYAPQMEPLLKSVNSVIALKEHTRESLFQIMRYQLKKTIGQIEQDHDLTCKISMEEFIDFALETLPDFESAKVVEQLINEIVTAELQDAFTRKTPLLSNLKSIRFEVDKMPVPDVGDMSGEPGSCPWKEERSLKRIRHGQRLIYKINARVCRGGLRIHYGELQYKYFPTATESSLIRVWGPEESPKELVGLDFAMDRLEEIASDRGPLSTGALLYGPPGTGKSSLVREFARKRHALVVSMTGADFSKLRPAEALETIKEMFSIVRKKDAILFIDELDGLGNRETGSQEMQQVIITFLSELDGINTEEKKTMIIGATNRWESIDPALLRPGRFSVRMELGNLYDPNAREALIENTLRDQKASFTPEVTSLMVQLSEGWSPALLAAVVVETCRIAGHRGTPADKAIVYKARKNVLRGGEGTVKPSLPIRELRRAAIHFGGHLCAAWLNRVHFIQVSIDEASETGVGEVEMRQEMGLLSEEDVYKHLNMQCGGRAAELIMDEEITVGYDDFALITQLASQALVLNYDDTVCSPVLPLNPENIQFMIDRYSDQISEISRRQMEFVLKQFREEEAFLRAVIEQLYQKSTLYWSDAAELYQRYSAKATKKVIPGL